MKFNLMRFGDGWVFQNSHKIRGSERRRERDAINMKKLLERLGITKKDGILLILGVFIGAVLSGIITPKIEDIIYPKEENISGVSVEDSSSLVAFNPKGEELWVKNLKNKIACYLITDLDDDGMNDIVVGVDAKGVNPGFIYAFDPKGNELWKYKTGSYAYGRSDTYTVTHILVDDLDHDGKKELVVAAHNVPWYPAKLIILDNNGKMKKEYLHPGYIEDVKIADIDGDGSEEIICGAINNDLDWSPTLFILDVYSMKTRGQAPPYLERTTPPGTHEYYIKIPKSKTQEESAKVSEISLIGNMLVASINDGRFYNFDTRDMSLLYISYADSYREKLNKLSEKDRSQEEEEIRNIKYL